MEQRLGELLAQVSHKCQHDTLPVHSISEHPFWVI